MTGNLGKAKFLSEQLAAIGLEVERVDLPLVEPQASSVEAVARAKAQQAFSAIGAIRGPLVVEDNGFCVDALRGFPGPYTKYALETLGAEGLLRLAAPMSDQTCRFVAALVYIDAAGVAQVFTDDRGVGTLARESDPTPCEDAWSDLWRIFIPPGASRPLSALPAAEREALWALWRSHSVYSQLASWLSRRGTFRA
ncbi:MAG: non-canonical purine NTP pyrophosphatase [Thermoanaerobaculia bacterium]